MEFEFDGEVWFWKGPAPWYFVTVPEDHCFELAANADLVTYGWGMIPVAAQVGDTAYTTSLWPKDGRYIVPLKTAVRKAERIDVGDTVTVRLTLDV
ncbi:DUF1905 domain-containing protein [Asanoa sp. WMMD1127]|uniref:DUF1905 domain-containing protein n=1 Tax=Asanoa sp. WMMD1127 TaxID=3016107 RepID=UPI002417ED47|nr:DUF1905 domain-containing protein [Asanoa sp. WMMD1127]MDG4820622.1 DUF1905 domain-containing protein [Asanoa sp. WMMD1127]